MTYRSLDAVHQQRIEEVRLELEALDVEGRDLEKRVAESRNASKALDTKLAREGPGGGAMGAASLRVPFIVGALCCVGTLLVPFEIYIGGYVHGQPGETIVPLLILTGPGLLGAVVAWPYRRIGSTYRWGVGYGAALILVVFVIIALGLSGVVR